MLDCKTKHHDKEINNNNSIVLITDRDNIGIRKQCIICVCCSIASHEEDIETVFDDSVTILLDWSM